jgi:ParB-like chromosome segregation protein Spo0J
MMRSIHSPLNIPGLPQSKPERVRPCTAVTELPIEDVLASPYADPVAHLDAARVQHYVQAGEAVAPIIVFDTEEGYLLVDGYHRVAAAKLRGADTI